MSEQQYRKNISLLYAFSFFWLALVIIPVIVPFFATKGLSLADVFVLQAMFAGAVVLFEVPSGYFADIVGRRNALIVGSFLHGLGFTLLYFVDSFPDPFWGLVVFEVILGVGVSLLSGSDLSLLYDSQLALGLSPRQKVRGIARQRLLMASAEGIASLLAAVLILWSFELVVYVNAVIAWIPLLIAIQLVEAPYERMSISNPLANFRRILVHLFYQDKLLRLTTLAVTFYGLSTFYVVWLIQPYWESNGVPLAWFGVLWAAKNFTIAITAKFAAPLEEKFGPVPVLLAMAVLPVVGYFGMALDGGVIGILLAFSFYISRGLHQVILTDAFNARVPSDFRATANSLTGFLFRSAFIVTGPLVGWLHEWYGMSVTLTVLGVASVLLFVVLMLPLFRSLADRGGAACEVA